MKPVTMVIANTLDEAVAQLGANAMVTAGGTDLYNALKAMIYPTPPDKLVSIRKVPGLDYIKEEGGMLKIGALTTLKEIAASSVVQGKWPILAQAANAVGTPQLRTLGTLGGNIAQRLRCWYYRAEHNEFNCLRKGGPLCYMILGNTVRHSALWPAGGCVTGTTSDTANALTALDATIVTTKKSIAIGDFYTPLGNVLDANELIKEVQVPTPPSGAKQAYQRYAERKAIDFAEVAVATVVSASDARIVLGAVSPVPVRATSAENLIKGKTMTADLATQAGDEAVKTAVVLPAASGVKAAFMQGNAYKKQLVKTLVKRALMT
jgi:xanthine dehydrogenase YagS FAD-binding subunit